MIFYVVGVLITLIFFLYAQAYDPTESIFDYTRWDAVLSVLTILSSWMGVILILLYNWEKIAYSIYKIFDKPLFSQKPINKHKRN